MDKNSADHPKARGLWHVKNKKKNVRGKATAHIPKSIKIVPNLQSNWDRYDDEEEAVGTLNSSTDFKMLANAPITHGSHFQFKNDKDIEDIVDLPSMKSMFNLNLELLNLSLLTIPFTRRSDIEEKYFTDSQRKVMASKVKANTENYTTYLENQNLIRHVDPIFSSNESLHDVHHDEEEGVTISSELEEESIDSTRIQNSQSSEVIQDLEQWLDDILDE